MRKKEDHKTKLNVLCHKTLSIKTNNSTKIQKIHKFTVLAELKIIEQRQKKVTRFLIVIFRKNLSFY